MSFLEAAIALSFILAILAAVPVSLFLLSAIQWYRMSSAARERRLFLLCTSGGRESGWYVECEGKKIAVLTDAKYFDIFWVSYQVNLMEPGSKNAEQIQNPNYWLNAKPVFRNRETDEVVYKAFVVGSPVIDGRLVVRGLYLGDFFDGPTLWERFILRQRCKRISKNFNNAARSPKVVARSRRSNRQSL